MLAFFPPIHVAFVFDTCITNSSSSFLWLQASLGQLFSSYDVKYLKSNPTIRTDLFTRPLHEQSIASFFASTPHVRLSRTTTSSTSTSSSQTHGDERPSDFHGTEDGRPRLYRLSVEPASETYGSHERGNSLNEEWYFHGTLGLVCLFFCLLAHTFLGAQRSLEEKEEVKR